MQQEYNQFIGIYKNVFNKSYCDKLIHIFNDSECNEDIKVGESASAYGGSLHRDDYGLSLNDYPDLKWYNDINDKVVECLDLYKIEYFGLENCDIGYYTNPYVKMQKTYPRGGYHIWHSEVDSIEMVHRVLAWMLYLNDIPEGEGETEFLFQGLRLQPEQGTLLIWPAHFTHMHRGNPVYTTEKYIATGWIEYEDIITNSPNSPMIYDKDSCRYKHDENDDDCGQDDDDHDILQETFKKQKQQYKRLSDLI
jgi:hypothetical protein|tara:strand:+ start:17235 stop:17987 length:753 start_codon:yes stop_codon:yes gene_type:complete